MANFNTHFSVALSVSGITGIGLYSANYLLEKDVLVLIALGTLGGLLPDLDSDSSRPLIISFNILSLATAFLFVLNLVATFQLFQLIIIWITIYVLIRHGIFGVFTHLTVHRGLFHSFPAALLLILLTTLLVFYFLQFSSERSWLYGFFIGGGYLIHLLLDELYSVNLTGVELKRSFGSAFTFFSLKSWLHYLCLYIAVIAVFWFAPPLPKYVSVYFSMENIEPISSWFNQVYQILVIKLF